MSISYPPASASSAIVAGVTFTNSSPTNSTPFTISAANPNRLGGAMIVNYNSAPLLIAFNSSPGAIDPSSGNVLQIPPGGGVYDIPASYQGSLTGILSAAGTGAILFVEPHR